MVAKDAEDEGKINYRISGAIIVTGIALNSALLDERFPEEFIPQPNPTIQRLV